MAADDEHDDFGGLHRDLVYATAGYEASIANHAQVSLASDNVFSDGSSLELATITGSVAGGVTATLTVAV